MAGQSTAMHLIINIPLQSGKQTLKTASAASFTTVANRFIFNIEKTQVKITRDDNIGNIREVLAPDCHHLIPAVRLTADDIHILIVENEAILEELDELLDKEVLGGIGEGASILHT